MGVSSVPSLGPTLTAALLLECQRLPDTEIQVAGKLEPHSTVGDRAGMGRGLTHTADPGMGSCTQVMRCTVIVTK